MGHHAYQKLRDRLTPEQRAQARAEAGQMMAEMLLSELRKFVGMTQEQLAEKLGITQPSLSKLENQNDMLVDTMRRLIEAMGGEMEIVARMPAGEIRVCSLRDGS